MTETYTTFCKRCGKETEHYKSVRKCVTCVLARSKTWCDANPGVRKLHHEEANRKGGKHYVETLRKQQEGLRGKRSLKRVKDAKKYKPLKNLVDPDGNLTQVHHQWLPGSAECRGVAIVEKDRHIHGYIDVIRIVEGEITLFTEEEIRQ